MTVDLGDRLMALALTRRLLDAAKLARIRTFAESRGGSLWDTLRELHLVADADLLMLMQEITGLDALNPSLVSAEPAFRACINQLWPPEVAAVTQTEPIRFVGNAVHVAMAEPWNPVIRLALEAFTGCAIVPLLMLPPRAAARPRPADVARIVDEHWRRRTERPAAESVIAAAERINRRESDSPPLEQIARSPEVILAVHGILCRAAASAASDVHFDPDRTRLRVRFRIDGRLRDDVVAPPTLTRAVMTRLRLLCSAENVSHSGALDAAFTCTVSPTQRVEARLSLVTSLGGERCTVRLVDRDAKAPSLSDLGMDEATRDLAERATQHSHGLILVSGPTGSGKTSTLYALLRRIVAKDLAVVTVEDPVERDLDGVVQVPCNQRNGLDFANVLRALLRQDPDVIMIGEIRDADTAHLAVRAANTGHLVLSSIHANSAAGAIDRFIDLGVERTLLAAVLRVVFAQRLVRRLCRACRSPGDNASGADGCVACGHTGYDGRVGIFETLSVSPAQRHHIASGACQDDVERLARDEGASTLRAAAMRLVREGETDLREVAALTAT